MPKPCQPPPRFTTDHVRRIECNLCGTRAYSGDVDLDAIDVGCIDASFAARGWKRMTSPDKRGLQVCRTCARKLSDRWTEIPVPALTKDARA